jgi:hypothetical protein
MPLVATPGRSHAMLAPSPPDPVRVAFGRWGCPVGSRRLEAQSLYQGDVFTGWRRNAFVGGLREGEVPRTGQLRRIEFNDRWEEIRRETLPREVPNQRIRDVREGPDGLLYVLTAESPDGAVCASSPAG